MLTIQIIDNEGGLSAIAEIPAAHAPAFRSAVTELRNELGERVAGAHRYGKEAALTRAVSGVGNFAGAVNRVIKRDAGDLTPGSDALPLAASAVEVFGNAVDRVVELEDRDYA